MENHPLTPMTDADLVRVLQRQTVSKVGLVRYYAVAKSVSATRESMAALQRDGVRMAIADTLSDAGRRSMAAIYPMSCRITPR
jgi:uncharacterized protein YgbK (DUF1537 family)